MDGSIRDQANLSASLGGKRPNIRDLVAEGPSDRDSSLGFQSIAATCIECVDHHFLVFGRGVRFDIYCYVSRFPRCSLLTESSRLNLMAHSHKRQSRFNCQKYQSVAKISGFRL